ncbi:uncharacterized protein LOC112568250 isoform X2 [Pomacea canaliculata]|uniref:uncharacterized protein LOC112568250 isoform X2 n=1 Tax=Pomacea canaliculata TaxID=400727 RepID=UPI000D72D89A|nr:uncharacterized protein LOC112568250 isoform X2 [Pomacea canaliculata]
MALITEVTRLMLLLATLQRTNTIDIVTNCDTSPGKVYRVVEKTDVVSKCEGVAVNTTVNFYLYKLSGEVVTISTCTPFCNHMYRTFDARRYSTVQYLKETYTRCYIYYPAYRDMAGTVVCSEFFSNGTTRERRCPLDIVYPFQLNNTFVMTNYENWTVTAVFSTFRVFSAMNLYVIDINEYLATNDGASFFVQNPNVTTWTAFEPFIEITANETYYKGNFTASWSLPSQSGSYYYTADLYPSEQTNVRLYPINGTLVISEPSQPTQNCNLTYVPEVGTVDCMCSTMSLGRPPGRLQWLVGNDVIAAGGYGVTQLQFPTNRVNRTHDGLQVTCQLDWVVRQRVVVSDRVAYGPESVSIQFRSENCQVIMTCTVDAIKPFLPDMIQWGGLCQGQKGAECTFKANGAEDDGKVVTCTVTNGANNGRGASSSVRIAVTGCSTTGNGSGTGYVSTVIKGSATGNGTGVGDGTGKGDVMAPSDSTAYIIGIAVAAALAVIFGISLLVVVVCMCRHRGAEGNRVRTEDSRQTTDQPQDNMSLYLHPSVSQQPRSQQPPQQDNDTCPPDDNHHYESIHSNAHHDELRNQSSRITSVENGSCSSMTTSTARPDLQYEQQGRPPPFLHQQNGTTTSTWT